MKALIINSGLGNRMGELTKDKPKAMAKLYNAETIFDRQIRILRECGIREFVVTTGPFPEMFKAAAAKYEDCSFCFVPNPEYRTTNYFYSMYLAGEYLEGDILMLHGDLVFQKELVSKEIQVFYNVK